MNLYQSLTTFGLLTV